MIETFSLYCVLSLIFFLAMIIYFQTKIQALESNIKEITRIYTDMNIRLLKKDPYEDYRNEKGLLSMSKVRDKHGKY